MRQFEYFKEGSFANKIGSKLVENCVELEQILRCNSCTRAKKAGPPVMPLGDLSSRVVIGGACPGRQEVEDSIPFNPLAPGGAVLDTYLRVLGLTREEIYITNACFCLDYRDGMKDRLPNHEEEKICATWKVLEWSQLLEVKYVILLGVNAIRQSFGSAYPSPSHALGHVEKVAFAGRELQVLICHHPGYVIRRPREWDSVKRVLVNFRRLMDGR